MGINRVLLIKPNTSEEFTKRVQDNADLHAFTGTTPVMVNSMFGPGRLRGVYDDLLISPDTPAIAEMDLHDAIVIACYSD